MGVWYKILTFFLITRVYVIGVENPHNQIIVTLKGEIIDYQECYIEAGPYFFSDTLEINYYISQGFDTVSAKTGRQAMEIYLYR